MAIHKPEFCSTYGASIELYVCVCQWVCVSSDDSQEKGKHNERAETQTERETERQSS